MTTEFDNLEAYGDAIPFQVVRKSLGMDNITLGQSIRAFRKCEEWTLAETASKLGISKQLLSTYETGKNLPSLSKIIEMATVFGIDPNIWIDYRIKDELKALGYETSGHIQLTKIAS